MTIKEGMVEAFKDRVTDLVAETRKEAGCIQYQLFQDVKNKRVLAFIEEWESDEALQQHMNSKHFQETVPKLSELQETEPDLMICSVVV